MLKKYSIPITLLIVGLLASNLFLLNQLRLAEKTPDSNISTNFDSDSELEAMLGISKKSKDVEELYITGWIPDWDIVSGSSSFQNQIDSFDSISPVYWYIKPDGTLDATVNTHNQNLLDIAGTNNVTVIPTITSFDPQAISAALKTPDSIKKHIDEIVLEVNKYNYEGIDLDYEAIYLKDKEKFFSFLADLKIELKKTNKVLVFTVLPKWGNEVIYSSLPQTRMVQDYKRIADIVDEFRIMTYEYTARDSVEIGPIAPIEWMERVIQYSIYSGVDREKIVIGIHTYSYDFAERELAKNIDFYPVLDIRGNKDLPATNAYFNETVEQINFSSVVFNEVWKESVGYFTNRNGEPRVLVFPDQKTLDARKELAAEYGIKGVTYWRVGGEANGLEY